MQDNNEKRKMTFVIVVVVMVLLVCLSINKATLNAKNINRNSSENQNQNTDNPNKDDDDGSCSIPKVDEDNQENNKKEEDYYPVKLTPNGNGYYANSNEKKVKPSISLLGSNLIYVEINSNYQDLSAVATDEIDGDITHKIVVDNQLDITTLGTYSIIYRVSNSQGQSGEVERTIIVVDETSPVISILGNIDNKVVKLDAKRDDEFTPHEVVVSDNSLHDTNLEISYWYHPLVNHVTDDEIISMDGYTKVEKLDLSKIGFYRLNYVAIDESGNRSEEVSVWYMVSDVKGPTITLSVMGTSHVELNPTTAIQVTDDFSDNINIYYSWSTSNKIPPSDYQAISNYQEVTPSNGSYYLWVKAIDEFGNESVLVSDRFDKNDALLKIDSFKTRKDNQQGYLQIGMTINEIEKLDEIDNIKISLYHDDRLVATAMSNDSLYSLSLKKQTLSLNAKIVVHGITDENSVFEVNREAGQFSMQDNINAAIVTLTKTNGQVLEVKTTNLDETNAWWEQLFVDFDYLIGKTRGDYSSIQEALYAAANDQLLYLLPDTYDEDLIIDKNVIIYGLDKDSTIIKGTLELRGNYHVSLVNLTVHGNHDKNTITLSDATLQMVDSIIEGGKVGILAHGNAVIRLSGVSIRNFIETGVMATDNVSCNIMDSEFIGTTNQENGIIYLDNTSGTIMDTAFSHLHYGVSIDDKCKDNVKLGEGITYSNCMEDLHIHMDIADTSITDSNSNSQDENQKDLATNSNDEKTNLSDEWNDSNEFTQESVNDLDTHLTIDNINSINESIQHVLEQIDSIMPSSSQITQ